MLDTDIMSFIVKGYKPVVNRLFATDSETIRISVVTEAEQRFGMKGMTPGSNLYRATEAFLEAVIILPWDSEAAIHFATTKAFLSSTKQVIGDLDTMIAAHAMAVGATLVTNNVRHFGRISEHLRLENWFAE